MSRKSTGATANALRRPIAVGAGGEGLSASEAERARRVGERILAELVELIQSLPIERRAVSEMSRWLGVTRPICQRVVQASRHRGDPLLGLVRLPGVQGLMSFVRAARRTGCDPAAVDAVEAAARRYADLIDEHGGSQARLVAAIEGFLAEDSGQPPGALADGPVRARQLIFEGARMITGRHYAAQVGIFLFRPRPDNPDRVDGVSALALLGVERGEAAMPVSPVGLFAHGRPDEVPDEFHVGPLTEAGASLPVGVLAEFCSSPPPRVIARRRGDRVSVLVEPENLAAFDVVLAGRFTDVPHPALDEPRVQTCYLHSDGPSRRLIITAFLHRSMAMRSVAMSGAFIRDRVGARNVAPQGRVHVATAQELWTDRLPDAPGMEYLGLGLGHASTPAHPGHLQLLSRLFELQAWTPEEFVGYRIAVDYPVWNAQYLINFDFPDEQQVV